MTESDVRRIADLVEWVLQHFADVKDQPRRDRIIMHKLRMMLGIRD